MEKWIDIEGYEGYYKVSNKGAVMRLKGSPHTKNNRCIKPKIKSNGYLFVCLSKNSNYKYPHIHRLVAKAFIHNPKNKPCVNHIDMDKTNNCADNLEWVTYKENNTHARLNKVFKNGSKVGFESPISKSVAQIKNGKIVYVWGCSSEISAHYSIARTAISKACVNNSISIGFYWKYISEKEYLELKCDFIKIPEYKGNKRSRDLSAAIEARKAKSEKITNESLLRCGVDCFLKYNNIYRSSFEEHARDNNHKGYDFVRKRFGGYKQFQYKVLQSIKENN